MADRLVRDENDAGVFRLDVDMSDGTWAERYLAHPPAFLLTGIYSDKRPRIRVDEGSTGFYEGREFRMFVEFDIPALSEIWVRHTITKNFILHDQRISVNSGTIRWTANAAMATSPGPWTVATMRRRNQMTEQPSPFFTSGSTIEVGGPNSATGGFVVDAMLVAAGNGAGSASVVQNAGLRGLAAGVYHARLQNTAAQNAVGVYDWWWEERT